MRERKLLIASIAVAIVLAGVCAELLGNAVYYARHGRMFYFSAQAAPDPGPYTTSQAVFHPYLSFIHRAGRDGGWWTTNNVGFQVLSELVAADPRCCDYPMAKREDEVLVGVFGGSVATGFVLHSQKYPEFGERLAEMPQWEGKRVRVLNFAMPGYKQPQQMIALAYYMSLGQHFDLIVNIDGFNEVINSPRNWESGAEPSFPADTLWGAFGRHLEGAGVPGIDSGRFQAAYYRLDAEHRKRQAEDCELAACYVFFGLLTDYSRRRSAELETQLRSCTEKATHFPSSVQSVRGEPFDVYEFAADQWASSSKSMAALAGSAGVPYVHVLQPNQWLKSNGEYEPIASLYLYEWMIRFVNNGYPKLTAQVPEMREAGIPVWDASSLFKGLPWRDIYSDDCCHYTDRGNALLAARIAEWVKAPSKPNGPG